MGELRKHILPTVEQQAALGIAQSGIAYRVAQRQAAMGVDPDLAVTHAVSVSTWTVCYWMAVVPVAGFAALCMMTGNPFLFLWGGGCVAIALVLRTRLRHFTNTPADRVLSYQTPTWLIVLAGGIWVFLLMFGWLFSIWLSVLP
jgi:hypothetical protein